MLITLVGYRATGKTTLAELLGERLGWEWADCDDEIERRAGKSIASIFAEEGEPAFRELEAAAVAELCRRGRLVLATGGGAPMHPESRRLIKAAGKVVWLRATPITIMARMYNDDSTAQRRPPLTGVGSIREIIQMLGARTPIYQDMADLVLNTDGRTPEELAGDIIKYLKFDE
ncbi:MAG: shikimate kinase [Pirellulales bacterium]|nr:shikimate kinase [Pirellulales bacterium]